MTAEALMGTVLTVFLTAIATSGAHWFFNRKTQRAQLESMFIEKFQKLLDEKKDLVEELRREVKELTDSYSRLEVQYNDCKQREAISELRSAMLQKRMNELGISLEGITRYSIFILDDEEFERDILKKKLSRIPNVVVETFDNIPSIRAALVDQPDILILDYKIGPDTIEKFVLEISKMPTYDPKIILVSGMPDGFDLDLKFKGMFWKTFSKRDDFINKTVNEVAQYISEQIKV